jgi:hypothetical protein
MSEFVVRKAAVLEDFSAILDEYDSERRLEAIEHEVRTIALLEPDEPTRKQAVDTAEAVSTLILVFDIATDEDTETEAIIGEIDRRVNMLIGEVNALAALWNGD